MSDDGEVLPVQKEVRRLERIIARLEKSRTTYENVGDRNSNFFRKLNEEIESQKRVIQEKNMQLELLAAKLAKYLSPQVYNSIFTGEKEVRIETYRRELTVFFCDIVGFTTVSDQLAPAKLAEWLNAYLDEMAQICLRYEGTLDKFIGDAVMVFFGDPKTRGARQDAVQCVRMAREMVAAAIKRGMKIRSGINSGECVVGNFGSDARMDYTVVGRNVNIASRLEGAGAAGRILVSEATWQLVRNSFSGQPNVEVKLKGIEQPVMTWWID